MKRLVMILIVLFAATACQVLGGDNSGGGSSAPQETIEWDRSPDTVVFRAETTGGELGDALYARNEVPYCTIFGDNRLVWTVDSGITSTQVLIDRLTDTQIRAFVSTLTIENRIYTFESAADLQPPTSISPVIEKITLFVNGVEHSTDSFSEWPPDYFNEVLGYCVALSNAPVQYAPDAAWISAATTVYDASVPSILWDGEAAGLKLADLAASGERLWVTDNNVHILWEVIRDTGIDTQFADGDAMYHVAVEVPGISPDAPPAPSE